MVLVLRQIHTDKRRKQQHVTVNRIKCHFSVITDHFSEMAAHSLPSSQGNPDRGRIARGVFVFLLRNGTQF